MIAQYVKELHFRWAVYADGDPVSLSDAKGHKLNGVGKVRTAATHLQSADSVRIAAG